MPINLVVNLTQREDVLVEKMLGRRVCSNCGYGYNLADIQRYPHIQLETDMPSPHFYQKIKEYAITADITNWCPGHKRVSKRSGRDFKTTTETLLQCCKSL